MLIIGIVGAAGLIASGVSVTPKVRRLLSSR
jgi:hypothetical protein